MALTGLDIFKLLPKTNCKKCGKPTCLAFAMQMAQKKASIDECPDVSEESKSQLGSASAPPIRLVTIGKGDKEVKIGEENVLFRHEEKFYHPTAVAVTIDDDLDDGALNDRLAKINALKFVRVGTEIEIDMVAIINKSGSADKFAAAAKTVSENTALSLILSSSSIDNMAAALAVCSDKKPLIHGVNSTNVDGMAGLAKVDGCPIAVSASTLDELAELSEKVKKDGLEDIVLDYAGSGLKDNLQGLTSIRRAALKKSFRPLGYPTMSFVTNCDDPYQETANASAYLAKYSGIVVVNGIEPWQIMPLLTVRQNIYTDPQKPVQVESKLYEVGQPDENAPLLLTTNFSLTYYSVEGEVEGSRVSSYILPVDTEGTSVLTAYSGDKLNEKVVKKAMEDAKVEDSVKHRKLIIPGLVAIMSAKLKDELGWEILVGPKEASGLSAFLKSNW